MEVEWFYIACCIYVIAAFITDIRSMKIPNRLTLPVTVAGVLAHIIWGGWDGFLFSAAGFAAGFGILFLMYAIGAVGAGDVKLFGGIGAWTGLAFGIHVIIYSVLYAGAIGLVILLFRKDSAKRIRGMAGNLAGFFMLGSLKLVNKEKTLKFPFMLAVLPGFITVLVSGLFPL
ncbi:A24 family peptidase [Paenibacillus sp. FSL R5-0766]|uniref:A24 family peptidase n=1 Tax=unclassified Paenibacillus TaxID=185978 RepID=UPI00096ED51B|nr:A24 family peptidase [Paenibacillus sp. FSL R5-0765]OMF68075.1 prepilin peptidase [Paenibacillus sp. FSL R5-0765]